MQVRAATEADFPRILELNAELVHFMSPLTPARLVALHAQSAWHAVADEDGQVLAFLLALREGCDYDSPNYRWFAERYPRFLYVDRVVVAVAAQGRGASSTMRCLLSRAPQRCLT
jgi:predicted GNAT superfamily acetyltransferase